MFNDEIADKWKIEALDNEGQDFTQKMVDWVIEELRYKARIFKYMKAVSVLNGDGMYPLPMSHSLIIPYFSYYFPLTNI